MVQATIERPATQQSQPPPQAIADALWAAYSRVFATETPVHARPGPVWNDGDPRSAPELAVLYAAATTQHERGAVVDAPLEPLWTNADAAFALAVVAGIAPPRLITTRRANSDAEYLSAEDFLGQEYL